jgi:O-antigen/teichoic acid export membrane protein
MTAWRRWLRLRGPFGLAVGSATGGLLAYVFFALVTRVLGPVEAAPVSVLWVWWGFAGAALTFPLQHWISRTVTAHRGELPLRVLRGRLAITVLVLALGSGLVAWLAREALFGRDDPAFPLLVVAVTLGSGLMGVVRGTLTARRRLEAVGASLTAENALRCVGAAALCVGGVDHPTAYGGCLVVGYLAAGLWPSALRFGREGAPPAPGSPMALIGGVGLGQLVAQITLTGGPLLLAVAGGAPEEVTALFATLALFRAPYTLAVGLMAALTGRLTSLVVRGRWDALRRIRLALVVVTLGTAAVAAALGDVVGQPLVALVFGEGVELDALPTALVAVGTVFALANLLLTITVMARGRAGGLLRGWSAGLPPGIVLFTVSGLPVVERTCWTFLVVEAAVFAWLVVEDAGAGRAGRSAGLPRGQEHR